MNRKDRRNREGQTASHSAKIVLAALFFLTILLTACGTTVQQRSTGSLVAEAPGESSESETADEEKAGAETESDHSETEMQPAYAADAEIGNRLGEEEWEWHYRDDPQMLSELTGNAWTETAYDDSSWLSGRGTFGSYEGKREEIADGLKPDIYLRQYLPDGKNVPVYYFRARFWAEKPEADTVYNARIVYDDSVIIYLNGTPVHYGNVPVGGYASSDAYGCDEILGDPREETIAVDGGLLKQGANILTVELHQANESSSDIYFAMSGLSSDEDRVAVLRNDTVCLGIGADETQMLVTWQGRGEEGYVEAVKAEDAEGSMPENARTYPAEKAYENDWNTDTFRAVLTDLEPGEEYAYRVVDKAASEIYTFRMPEKGDFSFIVNGDPQIVDESDTRPMENYETLFAYAAQGTEPAFILTLGDQSDKRDDEGLFIRYLSTPLSHEYPIAALVGNHENKSDTFSRFFYMPNMDGETIATSGDMSGDYWFFRNNTLFLCLNTNETDAAVHEAFLEKARAACLERFGEPVWTAAAFHHSLFSVGSHAESDNILERRESLVPLLEKADVDVVFMGHDHTYVRTFLMDGTRPEGEVVPEVTDPDGIVYFTLNCSTGTKYYDITEKEFDYTAVSLQHYLPEMARVDVTDTTFEITVYEKQKDDSVIPVDSFKIIKTGN